MNEELALNCLKRICKDLSPLIWFRYITVEWNDFRGWPVVDLWEKRPVYKHGVDDYGEEWEGWQSQSSKKSFIAMISTEFLMSTLGACPKDLDWSKLIIDREKLIYENT